MVSFCGEITKKYMKYKFQTKYQDKHGELWVKLHRNKELVIRISDGNIGGWFNGQCLIRVY